LLPPHPPTSTLFPYTTLFRSLAVFYFVGMRLDFIVRMAVGKKQIRRSVVVIIKKLHSPPAHKTRHPANSIGNSHIIEGLIAIVVDRKSTRLNSSHRTISYAVF